MIDLLSMGFVREALAASVLIGLMLSVMGVYVVVRRIVFVGVALAQVSASGVALGLLLGLHAEWVAMAAALVGVGLLSIRPRRVVLPSEGAIALGYAAASTIAILLIAKTPGGESDTLLLLYGNILAVPPRELAELAVLSPLLLAVHVAFRKEFRMVSFNPDASRAAGVPVDFWNFLLYVTLGVGIAAGIHVAGSLLSFTYLVVPPIAGLMVARRSWHVTAVAILLAVVGSVAGIAGSLHWDLPTGPTIVAVLVAGAGGAWGLARLRGGS